MDKKESVNKISYLVSKKNHDQAYAIIREFEKKNFKKLMKLLRSLKMKKIMIWSVFLHRLLSIWMNIKKP